MRALVVVALVAGTAAAEPPALHAASAVAIDAATGAELYAKRADDVRPIASMTKLFVALVLRAHHLDLARTTTIDSDDARAGEGGAGTRLLQGKTFANGDLLFAMLLASDNRTPSALARAVNLSVAELRDAMGKTAADLGLAHTRFTDVTGIAGNESTAREMALAMRAAAADRVLARYLTTRHADIASTDGSITASYTSTVWPLWSKRYRIAGGKTGHTEAAGYCVAIAAHVGTRDVVMTFLGAPTRAASFEDFDSLADYLARAAP